MFSKYTRFSFFVLPASYMKYKISELEFCWVLFQKEWLKDRKTQKAHRQTDGQTNKVFTLYYGVPDLELHGHNNWKKSLFNDVLDMLPWIRCLIILMFTFRVYLLKLWVHKIYIIYTCNLRVCKYATKPCETRECVGIGALHVYFFF